MNAVTALIFLKLVLSSLTFECNNYFFPILDHLGEPVACSSPVSLATSHKVDITTTPRGTLKVLTANVNHFLAKQLELNQFIIDNNVNIVEKNCTVYHFSRSDCNPIDVYLHKMVNRDIVIEFPRLNPILCFDSLQTRHLTH